MGRGNKGPGSWYNLGHSLPRWSQTLIYCEDLPKVLSGTKGPVTFPLGMLYWGLQPFIVCSNVDRRLVDLDQIHCIVEYAYFSYP